jgi:Matrixin/Putative peptidoglycan binding domain
MSSGRAGERTVSAAKRSKGTSGSRAKGKKKGTARAAAIASASSLPVDVRRILRQPVDSTDNEVAGAQRYLQRFGYLQAPQAPDFGALRARAMPKVAARVLEPPKVSTLGVMDDATEEAVFRFQAAFGLPRTAKIDEATLALMAEPRCGVPDPPVASTNSASFVLKTPWPKKRLRYRIERFSNKLSQENVREGIRRAFRLWMEVTPLVIVEAASGSTPDFEIGFFTGTHGPSCEAFTAPGGVLAHAFFPNQGTLSGDTHFDDLENWSVDLPSSGTDLVTAAAHEFGHALGLDHSTDANALMFPFLSRTRRHLGQDDIAGIQRLYGPPEPDSDD